MTCLPQHPGQGEVWPLESIPEGMQPEPRGAPGPFFLLWGRVPTSDRLPQEFKDEQFHRQVGTEIGWAWGLQLEREVVMTASTR